jgi:hypothetical protein
MPPHKCEPPINWCLSRCHGPDWFNTARCDQPGSFESERRRRHGGWERRRWALKNSRDSLRPAGWDCHRSRRNAAASGTRPAPPDAAEGSNDQSGRQFPALRSAGSHRAMCSGPPTGRGLQRLERVPQQARNAPARARFPTPSAATAERQSRLAHLHGRCPRKCPAAPLVESASSARHGCTASASRDIMTASVSREPHLAHRNFRSLSGTSPRPTAMMARRSAGDRRWHALHQTNKQSHESWRSMVLAVGGSVILVFDQPLRHANAGG